MGNRSGWPGLEGRGSNSRREDQPNGPTPPPGSDDTGASGAAAGPSREGRAQHGGSGREFSAPVAAAAAPSSDGGSRNADGGRDGHEAVPRVRWCRHGRGAEPLPLLRGMDAHSGAHVSFFRCRREDGEGPSVLQCAVLAFFPRLAATLTPGQAGILSLEPRHLCGARSRWMWGMLPALVTPGLIGEDKSK